MNTFDEGWFPSSNYSTKVIAGCKNARLPSLHLLLKSHLILKASVHHTVPQFFLKMPLLMMDPPTTHSTQQLKNHWVPNQIPLILTTHMKKRKTHTINTYSAIVVIKKDTEEVIVIPLCDHSKSATFVNGQNNQYVITLMHLPPG